MLGGIPANTVNARVFEADDHIVDHILDRGILAVQIGHTDILLGRRITVFGIAARAEVMEIGGFIVFENTVDSVRQIAVVRARYVVGDDVNDDLDAVVVRFVA